MNKIKKALLTFGCISAITPLALAVACGCSQKNETKEKNENQKTLEADKETQRFLAIDEVNEMLKEETINFENIVFPKEFTSLPSHVKKIKSLKNCVFLGEFSLWGTNVEVISEKAFSHSVLPSSFRLSGSIVKIGDHAFNGVVLPKNFSLWEQGHKTLFPNAYSGAIGDEGLIIPYDAVRNLPFNRGGGDDFLIKEYTIKDFFNGQLKSGLVWSDGKYRINITNFSIGNAKVVKEGTVPNHRLYNPNTP